MKTSLFLDQDLRPTFEKIAMPVKLSDTPDNWQREIASEVFKQLPYLADFAVNVVLDRVDAQRGYAFGSAEVTNQTDAPIPDQPKNNVTIPLIVKDRLLQPLDVMLDGKEALPLNERRLREKLFRTDAFETSTRKPTDQGMVDQLYPPMRTNYGYGNAVATGVGVGGFGKQASVCEAIAPTVSDRQFEKLYEKLASDEETRLLFLKNASVRFHSNQMARASHTSPEKTAAALVQSIKPTVVQFTKLASGKFMVKWANANAFMPQQTQVDPSQASAMTGQDMSAMQPGQTMTVTTELAKKEALDEPAATPIAEFGDYVVKDADSGQTYQGTVLPVVDFQMQPLPLFVFTDGAGHYSAQDEIVGVRSEGPGGAALQEGGDMPPQGDGVFVYHPQGGAKPFSTLPLTIKAMTQGPDGTPQIMAEDVFGGQLTLVMTPGLISFEQIDEDGTVAIPDDMQWVPLQGDAVHLAKGDTPDVVGDANALGKQVDLKATGPDDLSMEGMPVAKLARAERWFLKKADAEFLLCAMGLPQEVAQEAIKEACERKTGTVKLANMKTIVPLAEVHNEMLKKASVLLKEFDYSFWTRDLVKEAAALEDSETADKVLAMNFINPENVGIFASYLPELDETAAKLAEMLLAARLGMNQVPEGAAERAMKNLEEVIQGLRALQQKQLI